MGEWAVTTVAVVQVSSYLFHLFEVIYAKQLSMHLKRKCLSDIELKDCPKFIDKILIVFKLIFVYLFYLFIYLFFTIYLLDD